MADIVKKLRSPVDEKEDYFISQWPGEEPKTHDAVRFQAADEIERLRAALRFYAGWPQGPKGNIAPLLLDSGAIARAALGVSDD